jgi:hypothetical protein
MKKRFSIHRSPFTLVLLVVSLLSIAATLDVPLLQEVTTPDSDDVLAVFKSGNTQAYRKIKIGNLVPRPSDAGLTNDVWITVRTDGKSGDGSQRNPFNGSTQAKFDALMNTLPANTTIHLGPGTFQTNLATRRWAVKNGWQISGAGMYVTTLQAIGNVSSIHGGLAVLDNQYPSFATTPGNIAVRDLTLDGNEPGLTMPSGSGREYDLEIQGVRLAGSHNLVERIRTKNTYGTAANNRECFAIMLTGYASTETVDAIIRFCHVENMLGSYGNPFSISGWPATGNFMTGVKVYGNVAIGVNDGHIGTASTNSGGVNAGNVKYFDVFDNRFDDCESFFHFDTGTFDHVRIFNNVGKRLWDGVNVVGVTGCTNLEIRGNTATIQNRIVRGGVAGLAVNGGLTGLVISGNTITYDSSGGGLNQFYPIYAGTIVNARVEANTFSDGADGVTGHFTSSIFRGNRTDTGGTSTFLLDTDKILVTTATSGTVVVPAGITQVVLNASALTGAIGIQAPRRDRFTQFTIVDPKGIVNGSQQLVVSINSGDTKINGVAQSSIIATNYPNQTIVVTTNGIDGITVQRHFDDRQSNRRRGR